MDLRDRALIDVSGRYRNDQTHWGMPFDSETIVHSGRTGRLVRCSDFLVVSTWQGRRMIIRTLKDITRKAAPTCWKRESKIRAKGGERVFIYSLSA